MGNIIPPVVYAKIREFLEAKKSGQIVLSTPGDGTIQSYQLTENGRVPKEDNAAIRDPLADVLDKHIM